MKLCSHCKIVKSTNLFGLNKSQKDGFSHRCKDCSKKLAKQWRNKHPDRVKATHATWRSKNKDLVRRMNNDTKLKSRYGISRAEFLALYKKQAGRCGICSKETKLVVDHEHSSGKIRGLLCRSCNIGLGMFQDSLFAIRCAADYVVRNGK